MPQTGANDRTDYTIDINPRTIVVLVARQGEIENASVAALQDDNKA